MFKRHFLGLGSAGVSIGFLWLHPGIALAAPDCESAQPLTLASVGSSSNLAPPPFILAKKQFSDTRNHWAEPFISALVKRKIVSGFPGNGFKPDAPVTRAEFAAMLAKAFDYRSPRQSPRSFPDVTISWQKQPIGKAYALGFMSGGPKGRFNPNQAITRLQALVALSSGLELASPGNPARELSQQFRDANQVPSWAVKKIAATTRRKIVSNYPSPQVLSPNRTATRGEVAAFIYQALVNAKKVPQLAAKNVSRKYIVGYQGSITYDIKDLVPLHNQVRSEVGVGPITWSDDLAEYATEWANYLATKGGCKLTHRPFKGKWKQKYGENLFMGSFTAFNVTDAVKTWYTEKKKYDGKPLNRSNAVLASHYTQLVWGKTRKVGCAQVTCQKRLIVVCNYDPPGNHLGETPF